MMVCDLYMLCTHCCDGVCDLYMLCTCCFDGVCDLYMLCFRRIADVSEHRYPGQLKASAGFNNPRSVEYLSDMFDLRVNPAPSLMRGLRG